MDKFGQGASILQGLREYLKRQSRRPKESTDYYVTEVDFRGVVYSNEGSSNGEFRDSQGTILPSLGM